MARRTQWLLFAVAILFAAIASLIVAQTLKKVQTKTDVNLVSVVVATHRLAPHVVVSSADVAIRQMDKSSVPVGALHTTSQVVGEYTAGDWFAGEPVLDSMLTASSNAAAFPLSIPSGYRAYTVPNDAVSGVDHLISPGDHVDVALTYTPKSGVPTATIVLQDIEVLYVDNTPQEGTVAVASSSGGSSGTSSASASSSSSGASGASAGNGSPASTRTQTADTVTLALTPEQVEVLELARTEGQMIQLVLRNPSDNSNVSLAPLNKLP